MRWVLALLALAWVGGASAETAGVFQFVTGDVRVGSGPAAERHARKGTLVNVGELVTTGEKSTAQIKMGDGATVVVQPQSRLTVAVFHFTGVEDGKERVVFRLEQGGFRSVTGAIGHTHKANYLIQTPIAQIGVRGTDHESYYIAPGGTEMPGVYNKVNTGLTFIRTAAGEVLIAPNQVGYVASAQEAPALLPSIPGFFNRAVAPRTSQLRPEQPGGSQPAARSQPAVVQSVMTTSGLNLSNPETPGNAAVMPGTGSVAGFSEPNGGTFFGRSAVNPTIVPNGAALANTGGDAAWGVDWGSWQGGAPTVNGVATSGSVHFVNSTNLTTSAQLGALTAANVSATYNYIGGPAPTNQTGAQGTINSLSVGVNFGTQTVTNYAVNATAGGNVWNASGSGSISQFTGSGGIALTGTCAGCTAAPQTGATGTANGAFVGANADRMITSFGLKSSQQTISGAAYLGR